MPKYTPEEWKAANDAILPTAAKKRADGTHSSFINDFCQNCNLPMYACFHLTLAGERICQWCAYQLQVEHSAITTDQLESDGATFRQTADEKWYADITVGRVKQELIFNDEKKCWFRLSSISTDAVVQLEGSS